MRRVQVIPKNIDILRAICLDHKVNILVNPHEVRLGEARDLPGCWLQESADGLSVIHPKTMAEEINRGDWSQCDNDPAFWMPMTSTPQRGIVKYCPGCGARAEEFITLAPITRAMCGDCGKSTPWGQWRDSMKYDEALKVIENNWPDSGYSRLKEALTEIQRLAAIGHAEETAALNRLFGTVTKTDKVVLSKERALELLESVLTEAKADRLMKLFIAAHDTFVDKNGDYADAFAHSLRKHGDTAPLIRITDKFLRIENLLTGRKAAVKDETVNDTILDLGNYCFMWLMEKGVLADEHEKTL